MSPPPLPAPTLQEAQLHALCTGTVLRLLRARTGLTQLALARKASLTQRDLSRLETGQGRLDRVRLAHLAQALGVRDEVLQGFIDDAWARAGWAAGAAISDAPQPFWLRLEQSIGTEGVRALFTFSAAAAALPWPT